MGGHVRARDLDIWSAASVGPPSYSGTWQGGE